MSFQFHTIAGVRFQTSTLLEHGAIHHGFSTRLGGVSQGVYASLNLRRHGDPPDTPEHVQEILDAGDRGAAGPTAPACGLTLLGVRFLED